MGGPYRTILVDPPWPMEWERSKNMSYPTMSLKEISNLPIPDLADRDCQLWVWTTQGYLHKTFHLIEGWGFTYRQTVVWDKKMMGLGAWLRGQVEFLLLATRGDVRTAAFGPRGQEGSAWTDVIREERREHSRKPGAAYALVEALGEGPRLEMFARDRRAGWDCWGNQLSPTVQSLLPGGG